MLIIVPTRDAIGSLTSQPTSNMFSTFSGYFFFPRNTSIICIVTCGCSTGRHCLHTGTPLHPDRDVEVKFSEACLAQEWHRGPGALSIISISLLLHADWVSMLEMQPNSAWQAKGRGIAHKPCPWNGELGGGSGPPPLTSPGELRLCTAFLILMPQTSPCLVHARRLVFFSMVLTKRKGRIWKCLGMELLQEPSP